MYKRMEWREAISHPDFSHVRRRRIGGTSKLSPFVAIYHHASDSPSGVVHVASGRADEIDEYMQSKGKAAPLSPNESR